MHNEANNPVQSTRKSFQIIEALEGGPKRIRDLTSLIDLQKGAIHNHLATLVEVGFVVQDGKEYRLSLEALRIGGLVRQRKRIYHVAQPHIKALARETGEIANLCLEERGLGVFTMREQGDRAIQMDVHVGTSTELHTTAAGKTILAHLDRDRVEAIIETHGLDPITPRSVTEKSALFQRLETIRDRGYAIDRGERQEGLSCIAYPVLDSHDSVVAAISCSVPQTRLSEEELTGDFAEMVENAANLTELEYRY